MINPVQLISHPTAPVKKGIDTSFSQSLVLTGAVSPSLIGRPVAAPWWQPNPGGSDCLGGGGSGARAGRRRAGVTLRVVARSIVQRIHNPRDRECGCDPDCWCQRTAVGRAVKWWFPGRYFGVHHKNRGN